MLKLIVYGILRGYILPNEKLKSSIDLEQFNKLVMDLKTTVINRYGENSSQLNKLNQHLKTLGTPDLKNKKLLTDINEFYSKCRESLGDKGRTDVSFPVYEALTALTTFLLTVALSVIIGTAIGIGFGAWTGPGIIVPALAGAVMGLALGCFLGPYLSAGAAVGSVAIQGFFGRSLYHSLDQVVGEVKEMDGFLNRAAHNVQYLEGIQPIPH